MAVLMLGFRSRVSAYDLPYLDLWGSYPASRRWLVAVLDPIIRHGPLVSFLRVQGAGNCIRYVEHGLCGGSG